ncbi:MAG: hypothetical protein ACOXZO_06955 [Bacteroidales bacterium]|jgi:hypothetical protein|nr:hypothetical protein [Bacteroidales bacterium]
MKKLNKLQINPEKVMKNEELVTLRGGYDDVGCNPEDPGQIPCFCDGIFAGCQASIQACWDRCDY